MAASEKESRAVLDNVSYMKYTLVHSCSLVTPLLFLYTDKCRRHQRKLSTHLASHLTDMQEGGLENCLPGIRGGKSVSSISSGGMEMNTLIFSLQQRLSANTQTTFRFIVTSDTVSCSRKNFGMRALETFFFCCPSVLLVAIPVCLRCTCARNVERMCVATSAIEPFSHWTYGKHVLPICEVFILCKFRKYILMSCCLNAQG